MRKGLVRTGSTGVTGLKKKPGLLESHRAWDTSRKGDNALAQLSSQRMLDSRGRGWQVPSLQGSREGPGSKD